MTNEEFRLLLANYPDEYFVKSYGLDVTIRYINGIYINSRYVNRSKPATNKELQKLLLTFLDKSKVWVYGVPSFWYPPHVTCIDGIVEISPNKDEDQDRQPGH